MQHCLISITPLTVQKSKVCANLHHSALSFYFPTYFPAPSRCTPPPFHFSFFSSPFPLFLPSPLVCVSALIFCNDCHYVWVVHLFRQENIAGTWIRVFVSVRIYTTCCGKNVITNSESVAVHPCFISQAATSLFWQRKLISSARQELQYLMSLENPLQKHHFTIWQQWQLQYGYDLRKTGYGNLIIVNLRLLKNLHTLIFHSVTYWLRYILYWHRTLALSVHCEVQNCSTVTAETGLKVKFRFYFTAFINA